MTRLGLPAPTYSHMDVDPATAVSHNPGRHRATIMPALCRLAVLAATAALWACAESPDGPPAERGFRNLLLVSLDTCRPDHLSAYGYEQETTPNLDAVARDGVLFTRAYSTNPMTVPAHSSMLTGTIPPHHGVRDNNNYRLAGFNLTLAEIMREQGFVTAGFVGAFPLDARFGFDQGFEVYDGEFTRAHREGAASLYNERPAAEVSRRAIAWLEHHHERPFFLFLHYFDPHQPYVAPEPFASTYADHPYAGEIAYTDHHVGLVIETLKRLGLYESTLVIITGDHGQALGEHGETSHGYFVYNTTIRVPLIIRMPGGARGIRVDDPTSLIDIVPSVLGLRGTAAPSSVTGDDLSDVLRGGAAPPRRAPIYFESMEPTALDCGPLRGLVDGSWKYIQAVNPELYNLTGDAAEANNLLPTESRRAQELDAQLAALLTAAKRAPDAPAPPLLDHRDMRRLEALGYIGGGPVGIDGPEGTTRDPKDCLGLFERVRKAQQLFNDGRLGEAKTTCAAILGEQPRLLIAHFLLGSIALKQQEFEEAVSRYGRYLDILAERQAAIPAAQRPELDFRTSGAHNSIAIALQTLGRLDEAIPHYREAVRLFPRFAEAHSNLAMALASRGDTQESIEHYASALQIDPEFPQARTGLGWALHEQGRLDEAADVLTLAVTRNRRDAMAHHVLGVVRESQGKLQEAVHHYSQALEIEPDADLCNALAWIYAVTAGPDLRDASRAVELATRGAKLTSYGDPHVLDTLAVAYAAAGRFPQAIEAAEQAIELAQGAQAEELAVEIQDRLQLYRQGKPYRE